MMKAILTIIFISFISATCSYKTFDPKKDSEYTEYWCDPENIEHSILYDFSENKSYESLSSPDGCK